jgi:hypothetical protein
MDGHDADCSRCGAGLRDAGAGDRVVSTAELTNYATYHAYPVFTLGDKCRNPARIHGAARHVSGRKYAGSASIAIATRA